MEPSKRTGFTQFFHRRKLPISQPDAPSIGPEATQVWLQENGRHFHAALGVESQWDPEEQKFKAEQRLAIEHLEQVLSSHDSNAAPDEPRLSSCSWETVLDQLAQAKHDGQSQRDISSAVGAGIDLAAMYIEIIPEEYGLGVIKGALGLIFEATKRRFDNKMRILEAFETVPEKILTINTACAHLDASPHDLMIQRQFYGNLAKELPKLIEVLLGKEKWFKQVTNFFDLRSRETLVIDDILSSWTAYLRKLDEHMLRMRDKKTSAIHQEVSETRRLALQVTGKLDEATGRFDHLEDAIIHVIRQEINSAARQLNWLRPQDTGAEAQTAMQNEMKLLIEYQDRNFRHLQRLEEQDRKDINRLRLENSNLSHQNEILRAASPMPSSPGSERRRTAIVSHLELLGIISISPDIAWRDLDLVLQESGKFSDLLLGRVRWVLKTSEFLSWFQARQSSLLLVEAYLPSPWQKVSPLSVFGSNFVSSLLDSPSSVVLFFFGGLHCGNEDALADGPKGLIKSLITQLLTSAKMADATLEFLTKEFVAYINQHDTGALCELFEQLVLQVPPLIRVFCVLDGLVWYEKTSWSPDLNIVIGMLESIANRTGSDRGRIFKVLLTFAGRSLEVSERARNQADIWKQVTLLAGHSDSAHVAPFANILS